MLFTDLKDKHKISQKIITTSKVSLKIIALLLHYVKAKKHG